MTHIDIDASELRNLLVDLSGAPMRIQFGARKRMNQSRLMVEIAMKDDARDARRRARTHIPHLPDAITSEPWGTLGAEIGMGPGTGSGGQGSLAHIIVYGSVNNAPVYDHTAGLRRAEPEILKLFGDEAEEDVLGGQK